MRRYYSLNKVLSQNINNKAIICNNEHTKLWEACIFCIFEMQQKKTERMHLNYFP